MIINKQTSHKRRNTPGSAYTSRLHLNSHLRYASFQIPEHLSNKKLVRCFAVRMELFLQSPIENLPFSFFVMCILIFGGRVSKTATIS